MEAAGIAYGDTRGGRQILFGRDEKKEGSLPNEAEYFDVRRMQ